MIYRFFLLFCFLTSVTATGQNNEFSLTGKTANFEDGTYLYFRDLVKGGNLDSAVVRNNSFRFTTDLPEPTYFVMLFTKDKRNFTELWLENNPMTFDASKGNFKEAIVTGSKNQILFKKSNELYADIPNTDKEKIKQREKDFLKDHPDALVSAFILYGNKQLNQDEVRDIFSIFSEEVKNSSLGQRIAKYLEKDVPKPGEKYVDLSIPNLQGEKTKISDLKGVLTLLQFWSSGCGLSRNMNPFLAELYTRYKPEGFKIVSISRDVDKDNWLLAVKEDELPWPEDYNLISSDAQAFKTYGVQSTPSNFLVNSDGIIVAKDLRGEELEKKIRELLN